MKGIQCEIRCICLTLSYLQFNLKSTFFYLYLALEIPETYCCIIKRRQK